MNRIKVFTNPSDINPVTIDMDGMKGMMITMVKHMMAVIESTKSDEYIDKIIKVLDSCAKNSQDPLKSACGSALKYVQNAKDMIAKAREESDYEFQPINYAYKAGVELTQAILEIEKVMPKANVEITPEALRNLLVGGLGHYTNQLVDENTFIGQFDPEPPRRRWNWPLLLGVGVGGFALFKMFGKK